MDHVNPRTGSRWRRGDVAEDGRIFRSIERGKPLFIRPEDWDRYMIASNRTAIRRRAKADAVLFDLTTDYLVSIFPPDRRCPILGIEMTWGGPTRVSNPSLDRIDPSKGYVRGNVAWISLEANRMKSNASLEVLKRLVAYVEAAQSKE